MSIKRPSRQDMTDIAEYYGMNISDSELAEYQQLLTDTLASFDRIDELEAPVLVSGYKRDKGSAADPDDNPHNAWYWKTTIEGATEGPLQREIDSDQGQYLYCGRADDERLPLRGRVYPR